MQCTSQSATTRDLVSLAEAALSAPVSDSPAKRSTNPWLFFVH